MAKRRGDLRSDAKRDYNEKDIIKGFMEKGCKGVIRLTGSETLDLLINYMGIWFQVEVKNPEGRNRETPAQIKFFEKWKGEQAYICRHVSEVEDILDKVVSTVLGGEIVRKALKAKYGSGFQDGIDAGHDPGGYDGGSTFMDGFNTGRYGDKPR